MSFDSDILNIGSSKWDKMNGHGKLGFNQNYNFDEIVEDKFENFLLPQVENV